MIKCEEEGGYICTAVCDVPGCDNKLFSESMSFREFKGKVSDYGWLIWGEKCVCVRHTPRIEVEEKITHRI